MLSRLASRLVQTNKLSIVSKRNFNGILYQFGPPKNKLPQTELAAMGVVLLVGILGPSLYLASDFKNINGRNTPKSD